MTENIVDWPAANELQILITEWMRTHVPKTAPLFDRHRGGPGVSVDRGYCVTGDHVAYLAMQAACRVIEDSEFVIIETFNYMMDHREAIRGFLND